MRHPHHRKPIRRSRQLAVAIGTGRGAALTPPRRLPRVLARRRTDPLFAHRDRLQFCPSSRAASGPTRWHRRRRAPPRSICGSQTKIEPRRDRLDVEGGSHLRRDRVPSQHSSGTRPTLARENQTLELYRHYKLLPRAMSLERCHLTCALCRQ